MEDRELDDILGQINLAYGSVDDDEQTHSSLKNYNIKDDFAKKLVNLESSILNCPESGVCIRCNRDGCLLKCVVHGCSIVVHEKCMNCNPKFDETGKFYCPYCWYKLQAARARELLNKVREEKKALLDFMDSNMVGNSTDNKSDMEDRENTEKVMGLEERDDEHFSLNEITDHDPDERITSIGSLNDMGKDKKVRITRKHQFEFAGDEEMPVELLDKHILSDNVLNGEVREDETMRHEDDVPGDSELFDSDDMPLTVRKRCLSTIIKKQEPPQHPDSTLKTSLQLNSSSKRETRNKRNKSSLFQKHEQMHDHSTKITHQKPSIEKRKKFFGNLKRKKC